MTLLPLLWQMTLVAHKSLSLLFGNVAVGPEVNDIKEGRYIFSQTLKLLNELLLSRLDTM